MRILVLSDSHRNARTVERIIAAQPTAQTVFFLGDLTDDIERAVLRFPDRKFHIVSGNCDGFSPYPSTDLAEAGGKRILFTHGHTIGVKYGPDRLIAAARQRGCDIALYGHTHIPATVYDDGVYAVNPGSCAESRSGPNTYAVIDIEPNGVMPVIIEV